MNLSSNKRRLFSWLAPLMAIIVFFTFIELALSAAQLIRWKSAIKPYNVTWILRPVLRLFVKDDLIPPDTC
jgi:hypothetical protein